MCRHCGYARANDDAVPGLCVECADLAVWGSACSLCDRQPTGRERVTDRQLDAAGISRSDPRAVAMAEA